MSRRRLLPGAAVAVAGLALVLAPEASAEPPAASGWWTQRPGAAPVDGAVEVANSLRGDESVAAVRLALPEDTSAARLVLTVTGTPTGTVALQACPATSAWEAAEAGAFDGRPEVDCAASVAATDVGGGQYAIELGALLDGGTADVVLLPLAQEVLPGVGASVGFTAAFTLDVVVGAAPATTATTETAAAPAPASSGSATPPAAPAPRPSPRPSAPVVRPSPVPAGVPTTVAGATGADPSGGSLAASTGATVAPPSFTQPDNDDGRPWGRLLLLVPLSVAVGLGAAAVRGSTRLRGGPGQVASSPT